MSKIYKVIDKKFIEIVLSSENISQALKTMGLTPYGSSYIGLKKRCNKLGIKVPGENKQKEKIKKKLINDSEIIQACSRSKSRSSALKMLSLSPIYGSNIKWIGELLSPKGKSFLSGRYAASKA